MRPATLLSTFLQRSITLKPSLPTDPGMAPKDPILGVTEASMRSHSEKSQPGVGVYLRRQRQGPVLDGAPCRQKLAETPLPRNYPLPIDGLTYDPPVQGLLSAPQAMPSQRAYRHRADAGGTAAQGRRAIFCAAQPEDKSDQRPEWETIRRCSIRRITVMPILITMSPTHGVKFDAMIAALQKLPAGSSRCSCVLPQSDGRRSDGPQHGKKSSKSSMRAAVPSSTSPTRLRREHRCDAAAGAASRKLPVVFVASHFQIALALWGARGRLSIVTESAEEGRT